MHVKIVVSHIAVNAPDTVLQHRTRHNLPTVTQKQLQQLEFTRSQLYALLAIGQAIGRAFQRISTILQLFRTVLSLAAAQSVQTCHQLLQLKRLYQIVVRTAVQTLHLIRQRILGRQQQYFPLIILFTQALTQVKSA